MAAETAQAARAPAGARAEPAGAGDADPVAAVRRLADTIDRHAAEGERLGRIAPPAQEALVSAGLFRMLLPRVHGGMEATPPVFLRAIEAAARLDGSTAWCLCQGNGCAMVAAYLPRAAGREVFGRDPRAVLAWGPGPAEARAVPGGYRLTARIAFASGGRHATWLGCHAPVVEADGSRRTDADGSPSLLTLVFPESSARWIDTWDVIGLRATGSDDFEVADLFVPDARTAIRDRDEARTVEAPLYAMPSMAMYAIGFSATAQGIARAMLEAWMDLALEKTPRLAARRLRDDPVVQSDMARCEARLRAARALLVSEVADIWDEVRRTGALSVANRARIRLAATHGIQEAKAAAETVYDLAGSSAIRADGPFERRYRDLRAVTQQLQGRASHYRTVGAFLLGHEADLSVM